MHFEDEMALLYQSALSARIKGLIHFANQDAMNITGLGPAVVGLLIRPWSEMWLEFIDFP